jgi:hypothetical protein
MAPLLRRERLAVSLSAMADRAPAQMVSLPF